MSGSVFGEGDPAPADPTPAPADPAPADPAPNPAPADPAPADPAPAPSTAPADPVSQPFFMGMYDKDGNIDQKAFERLPEHLQHGKETFSRYKTVEELMGAHMNLRQQLSKGGLVRPDEGAPEQVVQEFQAKMAELNGAPESPEGYELAAPEGLDENILWPDGQEKQYAEIFHKHGANPEMVKEIFDLHIQNMQSTPEEIQKMGEAHREQVMQNIIAQHGQQSDQVVQNASQVADYFELSKEAKELLGTNHELVNLANRVKMEYMGEDKFVQGNPDGNIGPNGNDNLAKAEEFRNKAADAYDRGDTEAGDRYYAQQSHYNKLAAARMTRGLQGQ